MQSKNLGKNKTSFLYDRHWTTAIREGDALAAFENK